MSLPFVKVEAVGNSFVLLNGLILPEMDWCFLAREMCAYRFGVGSDGLLLLQGSDKADFYMRMFNPDGSEDVSGNGLRCMAAYLRCSKLIEKNTLTIEARDGIHHLEILDFQPSCATIKVSMGCPSFKAADLPAEVKVNELIDYRLSIDDSEYCVTGVAIGTPHIVILSPADSFWDEMPYVSGMIEKLYIFPERVSVTWCAVESFENLRIRTWERAVGPTLGCGTGACAALASASIHGLAGERAYVTSPGGTLEVEWPDKNQMYLIGPAGIVFEGEWPLARYKRLSPKANASK